MEHIVIYSASHMYTEFVGVSDVCGVRRGAVERVAATPASAAAGQCTALHTIPDHQPLSLLYIQWINQPQSL